MRILKGVLVCGVMLALFGLLGNSELKASKRGECLNNNSVSDWGTNCPL